MDSSNSAQITFDAASTPTAKAVPAEEVTFTSNFSFTSLSEQMIAEDAGDDVNYYTVEDTEVGSFVPVDTDSDGISDDQENIDGTDPTLADTDGDGVDDGVEKTNGTDPLNPDTDGDGLTDKDELMVQKKIQMLMESKIKTNLIMV